MALTRVSSQMLNGNSSSDATVTALGSGALNSNTASYNTAVGYQSLYSNTTGAYSVAVGYQALYNSNHTANIYSRNVAIGYQALYNATTGSESVAIGTLAGYSSTGPGLNVFVGEESGYAVTTGQQNCFVGYGSGGVVTTGTANTILGSYNGNQGGLDIRTSSNYIVLSDGNGNPRGVFGSDGELYVGITGKIGGSANGWFQTTTTNTKPGIAISANVSGANAINWYNSSNSYLGSIVLNASTVTYGGTSDYRLKENIAPMTGALVKVSQLKPCTFTWKNSGEDGEGFIAHELAEVCPSAVVGEKDAVNEDGSIKPQQVDASFLIATLTAAIQELKAEVDSLKAQLGK